MAREGTNPDEDSEGQESNLQTIFLQIIVKLHKNLK